MNDFETVYEALECAGYPALGTVRYSRASEALDRIEAEVKRLRAALETIAGTEEFVDRLEGRPRATDDGAAEVHHLCLLRWTGYRGRAALAEREEK